MAARQLPDSLQAKGIVFIGPTSGPMHALGDKIGATIIAQVRAAPTAPQRAVRTRRWVFCCSRPHPPAIVWLRFHTAWA